MKWLQNRQQFLNEAKIRDIILPRQAKLIKREWAEKYLDYEEVTPTDKIKQGKWKLSEEDKFKALGVFFGPGDPINFQKIFGLFENLPGHFKEIFNQSVDIEGYINEDNAKRNKAIMKDFDSNKPTIAQISLLYEPIFRKLSVKETIATERIERDDQGRPIIDTTTGKPMKIKKLAGEPIWEKNFVNVKIFIDSYNRSYKDNQINSENFYLGDIKNFISMYKDTENDDYVIDFEVLNKDVYLSINHNASHILNMSISTFYASCMHLYDGVYNEKVLSNVFDPNSIPAFLIFDTDIHWKGDKISDFLPLSRMVIRNIENIDDTETKIYFDRSYPDRMKDIFSEFIEKYSDNKPTAGVNDDTYYFTPDVDIEDDINEPYMDELNIKVNKLIGKNVRRLYLNKNYNWDNIRISPNARIKEIVIETEKIPENFMEIKLEPDWIKLKFIKINSLDIFQNIKTENLIFDKCKFDAKILKEVSIKKLKIISCEIDGKFELNSDVENLSLIYTLDDIDELKSINLKNITELTLSGDLISDSDDKKYLNELKKTMKVNLIGPVM